MIIKFLRLDRLKFNQKILLFNVIIIFVPMALLGGIYLSFLISEYKNAETQNVLRANQQLLMHLDTFWDSLLAGTQMIFVNRELQSALSHENKNMSEAVTNVQEVRRLLTVFSDQFQYYHSENNFYFGSSLSSTVYSNNDTLTQYQSHILPYSDLPQPDISNSLEQERFVFRTEYSGDDISSIAVYQKLLNFSTTSEIGILRVDVPISVLKNLVDHSGNYEYNISYLSETGDVITHNDTQIPTMDIINSVDETSGVHQNSQYLYTVERSELNGFLLCVMADMGNIYDNIGDTVGVSAIVLIVCLIIGGGLGLVFEKILYRRVQWLFDNVTADKDMIEIAETNFTQNDEFELLNSSFKNMLNKIELLTGQKYEAQMETKNIQLELLQDSINPHLLYNTLSNLSYRLNRAGNNEESELVNRISLYYKYVLNKGGNRITIEQEMDSLQKYIDIIKYIYDLDVKAYINVAQEFEKLEIHKMLLQPLVENALLHGIRPNKEGVLSISVTGSPDGITIVVEDDGVGIDEATLCRIENNTLTNSYAIQNIKKRLDFYYSDGASLYFTSKNMRTTATIVLPNTGKEDGKHEKI